MAIPSSTGGPWDPERILQEEIARERASRARMVSGGGPLREIWKLGFILGLAWLVSHSPFRFLLQGFHVWIHELGHSSVAWFSGYQATPLPIGWTNISMEPSHFVSLCLAFLLGAFAWAGWRERLYWIPPTVGLLILAQAYLTFGLDAEAHEEWQVFGGVAGEFVISTLFMVAYFLPFPEKFHWDRCRYGFLFIGATCFYDSWSLWAEIRSGRDELPFGSMIHGSGDEGGDMNRLMGFMWTQKYIISVYSRLAMACLWTFLLATGLWIFSLYWRSGRSQSAASFTIEEIRDP